MRNIVILGIIREKTLKCDHYRHVSFAKSSNLIKQFSKQEFSKF